jgi:biotin carboxyl carrier protein
MEFYYQSGDEVKTVIVQRDGDRFQVKIGGQSYVISQARLVDGRLLFEMEGQFLDIHIADEGSRRYVALAGESWSFERLAAPQPQQRSGAAKTGAGPATLEATMPGLVAAVLVAEGETVERGQTLVLLEAMKMELRVAAPHAGRVGRINCAAGQVVERGQTLVELESL